MIQLQETVLVVRNARDKIQVARYLLMKKEDFYVIKRYTGQFGGKMTEQPDKIIEKGKVKRSALQQVELEYNSIIKKATDKGYKKLSDLTKTKFENITSSELDKIVPSIKTDSNGIIKPQLAKSHNDCATSVFNKPLYGSRKIDGVRCMFLYNEEEDYIYTSSRGGGDYNISAEHLTTNETLLNIFRNDPKLVLDGELYVHGWPLQKISGTCRLKTRETRCNNLEFWIFDIVDPESTFEERLNILEELKEKLKSEEQFKVLDHIFLQEWNEISRFHDKVVKEGFEGVVVRKPDKKYSPGKRNSDWIKIKEYEDSEFEITGIEHGLRDEDMCFILKTKLGKSFKAKPIGNRELKLEYLENWPLYVGKLGTVKYFNLSLDGVPTQPIFKYVREE